MASFQIHVDQENKVSRTRKLLKAKTAIPVSQRSVLGTINANLCSGSQLIGKKKEDGKKLVATKSTKPPFAVQEDILQEEAQIVKQSIKESKACQNKEKTTIVAKETRKPIDLPTCVTALPQQSLQEIRCLTLKDEEEKMSECSFSYDSPMSIDKSIISTSPKPSRVVTKNKESIYDLEEYRDEIFKYMVEIEDRNRPKPFYMRRQPDVTYNMRTILVDWLVEVALEYKIRSETLHIAVFIIDRFLSLMSVVRAKLQLLGTTAMFIASKYEEIYPPEVGEFVYITDDTYTKKQVLRMEHLILKVLMFDISVPTTLSFIKIMCLCTNQNEKVKHLAAYLCELTLLEGDPYLGCRPSMLASSTIAMARFLLDEKEPWSSTLVEFSGYSLDDLATIIGHLNDTHAKSKSIQHQAVQEKYKSKKYDYVGTIEHTPFIVFSSNTLLKKD